MLKHWPLLALGQYYGMERPEDSSISKLLAVGKLASQTKVNYVLRIRSYLRRVAVTPDSFVRAVNDDPRRFEEEFIVFIGEVSKESAPSTVAFWRDALKKFLEVNRVKGVDWDYVNQFIPKIRKSGLDRAPTVEEIRRLAAAADQRTKCAILFLSSSGARIGSVEYLRWRDFQEIESTTGALARVRIYNGEPEQYDTFVTPECWASLQSYRQGRVMDGEKVTEWTPVFVRKSKKGQLEAKPVGVRTLKNQLGFMMNQMMMRSPIIQKERFRCYEFKQAHGFRKFFKTRMEMSGAKPIITEMLMGHALGVAGSYMKPTQKEMLDEYSKAIVNLTISVAGSLNTTGR